MASPAWEATPEVDRYHEALDWFAKRTVITGADAKKLDDSAKKHAFWVGGGLQLAQIQRAFDHINKGIERGETLEEIKKSLRDTIRNPNHAETVVRNAVQRAYNAGRYKQMREPFTARLRPFWLFDTVLDDRRTPICKVCHGVILRNDHPWWLTHVPPLHHRCRSSIRCLRARDAERRGIAAAPPGQDGNAKPGWGQAPDVDDEPPKPDPAKTDPEARRRLTEQEPEGVKAREPVAPPPPAPKEPELDKARWLPEYEPKYGAEASKSLAHGRAAFELGLDMPVGEVLKQVDRLPDGPLKSRLKKVFEINSPDLERTLRAQGGELLGSYKVAAAVAGHLRTLAQRTAIALKTPPSSVEGARVLDQIAAFFQVMTGQSVVHPTDWSFRFDLLKRGSCSYGERRIVFSNLGVGAHEWAHAVERLTPELEQRAIAFLQARTKGKKLETLRSLTGIPYKRTEKARRGGFFNYYVGKDYSYSSGQVWATEVGSMGTEVLVAGEVGGVTLTQVATDDFDHLLFILGQLAGP